MVMQHVPVTDRLTSCCLVNRRLHAAAVAATDSVELQGEDTTSLLEWLPQYGHNVMKLSLSNFPQPLQQLGCPNLQELQLNDCSIQLGPTADGQVGVIQGCSKLTRLDVTCHIMDGPVVDILSRLVHLQHLSVRPMRPGPTFEAYECCIIEGLSSATLPCLQQLTHLKVFHLSVENLTQLGALAHLQELYCGVSDDMAVSPSSSLVFPTSLKVLVVGSDVEIGVLSLLPTGLTQLNLLSVVQGPAEGPDLLSGLHRLQQVNILSLSYDDELMWPAAGPAYSALTASNSLHTLEVLGRLPDRILPHVFPTGLRLLHLTYLRFSDTVDVQVDGDMVVVAPPVWSAGDLSRLVNSCPNLRGFKGLSLQHGTHVSVLSGLQNSCSLHVEYPDGADVEVLDVEDSIKGLAALTQLDGLLLKAAEECSRESLLPLTSLTARTLLDCRLPGFEDQLYFLADQDNPCDPVWLQLLKVCANYNGDAPIVDILRPQLAEQLTRTAQLQQELSDEQRRIAAQQQVIADQAAQLLALQQVAAEQSVQIAAMKAQLVQQHAGAQHPNGG